MVLLFWFAFSLVLFRRKGITVFHILILLQLISLCAMLFVSKWDLEINGLRFFNVFYTGLLLTIIVAPFRHYSKIGFTSDMSYSRVKIITKFLLVISSIVFITLLITGVWVLTNVEDINRFKYVSGERMRILIDGLPIRLEFFTFSNYAYIFSYFLIPLHFYYIKKSRLLSNLCLLFSLNLILFGLTFFSRWTITHYLLIYGVFLFLFRDSLSAIYLKRIKRFFFLFGILMSYMFYYITFNRFSDNSAILRSIPEYSLVQNPVLYSIFSYLSQWYENGLDVLELYDMKTLQGQASFNSVLKLLHYYTPVNWDVDFYKETRIILMSEDFYKNFTGLVANWIYDFGYYISLLLAFLYSRVIYILRPRNNVMPVSKLLLFGLLVQIPLFAIFYSVISGILTGLIFYIFIYLYLRRY